MHTFLFGELTLLRRKVRGAFKYRPPDSVDLYRAGGLRCGSARLGALRDALLDLLPGFLGGF